MQRPLLVFLVAAPSLGAQVRDATRFQELVAGLTVTPRVLVIGARPEDADSRLLAWLARGRHVQTAYLSLTRGESAGNFLGIERGVTLGAIRTQESLRARAIDGAEQFFTRMYDVGYTRSDSALFARWNRDSLLGDIVTTIRSFRPHVIIAMTVDTTDSDRQRRAVEELARAAFDAAPDGRRFHPLDFGDPWSAAKLYGRGPGLTLDASAYDTTLGETYAEIALQARAQHRSQGLLEIPATMPSLVTLRLAATGSPLPAADSGLFSGLDTSLTRLASFAAQPRLAMQMPAIVALADSARQSPTVERLAQLAALVADVRAATPACRHPVAVIPSRSPKAFGCEQALLDLDAALDLLSERATAALLIAARVTIEATTDRELLAASDTAPARVRVANHGGRPVTIVDVKVWGDVDTSKANLTIPPDSATVIARRIVNISTRHQWWMGTRVANRYETPPPSLDGLTREARVHRDTGRADPAAMAANGERTQVVTAGVAIPEHLRRASDVTVTLAIAGATITTSVGPLVYRHADPVVGLQQRPIAGTENVTLNLDRALQWVPAGRPIVRDVHVNIRSHSSAWQRFGLRVVVPPGLRDSLKPNAFALAPRDQRDVSVRIRGSMEAGEKQIFGVIGSVAGAAPFATGYQTVQYPQLLPIRLSRQSGLWLQPVEISVPRTLTVVHVPGVPDDISSALRDIGTSVAMIPAGDLPAVDLGRVTTVAIGPRAFEAHKELLLQMPRLMTWVRGGGTLLVLRGTESTLTSGALPHLVDLGMPVTQRVSSPDAPVMRVVAASKLLQWPNVIGPNDWKGWVGERAPFVPTSVDPRFERVIEMTEPGERATRNALLVSREGKGLFVYTALTLDEQIAAGVPGALRILVNLLSAGITPPGARP